MVLLGRPLWAFVGSRGLGLVQYGFLSFGVGIVYLCIKVFFLFFFFFCLLKSRYTEITSLWMDHPEFSTGCSVDLYRLWEG